MTPHQYKETRERELIKNMETYTLLEENGHIAKGAVTDNVNFEEIHSFHTASLDGLLDIIEEWAEKERNNIVIGDSDYWRGYVDALKPLLTFIGRDTK